MSELESLKKLPSDLNQAYLGKIYAHLEKDFALCQMEIDEELVDLDSLRRYIINFVSRARECQPENFFGSLYRLDIPDHITKSIMQEEDPYLSFTQALILRAYPKVRLREIYS